MNRKIGRRVSGRINREGFCFVEVEVPLVVTEISQTIIRLTLFTKCLHL